MDQKDFNEIKTLIPKGLYDPSEIVLIGSHMEPSPIAAQWEEDATNANTNIVRERPKTADEARREGWMLVRSDLADLLVLTVDPKYTKGEDGRPVATTKPTIALIYAYGYEGHTYRLAKPRIMIVHGEGEQYDADREKDPSPSLTGKLYMWRLSKHHQTVSIEVESGELENLVLEANQPGNRSVNSYAAHMQMSHRGGKLT